MDTISSVKFRKIRLCVTAAVSIAIWVLLAWDHFHGGIPRHHILANEALPAISNAWGGLLLPLLTWFLLYRIQMQALGSQDAYDIIISRFRRQLYRFTGALLFGVVLSAFFTTGYADICGYLVLGLFPLALVIPIYRAECVLGFVFGMTFTFGAILPTAFGLLLSLAGAVLYLFIRPGLWYVGTRIALVRQQRP
ncbi:hypothetical protein [Pontibacter liquoris]|uniref:hypothetical protein n=1 Tax=Pontibacter liquoris TaxID=2905677 RepID=UPI001FA7F57A|nr:hypothetical protein [Pontibacter liquoris]